MSNYIQPGAFNQSTQKFLNPMVDEQGNVSKLAFLRQLINAEYMRMRIASRRQLDKRKTI